MSYELMPVDLHNDMEMEEMEEAVCVGYLLFLFGGDTSLKSENPVLGNRILVTATCEILLIFLFCF